MCSFEEFGFKVGLSSFSFSLKLSVSNSDRKWGFQASQNRRFGLELEWRVLTNEKIGATLKTKLLKVRGTC